MKTALCLFGIVGGIEGKNGKGAPVDFARCFEHYKKHVIDVNACDVFIHSWSREFEQPLVILYKPRKHTFESLTNFRKKLETNCPDQIITRNYYRWYSTKKVIELKKQYEKENNFKYDQVMIGRFDLMFFVDIDFSKLDPDCFYVPKWNRTYLCSRKTGRVLLPPNRIDQSLARHKLQDIFFIANSILMDKFASIYEFLPKDTRCSPHILVNTYLTRIMKLKPKQIKRILWRWYEYELYRWKVCHCFD